MDSFSGWGEWQIPEFPDTEFPGELKFVPGEENELMIRLPSGGLLEFFESGEFKDVPIIFGYCNSLRVTLYKCQTTGTYFQNGRSYASLSFEYLLTGIHFEHPDEIVFKYIQVNFTDLNEWIGLHSFNTKFQIDKSLDTFEQIDLSYKLPDKITFKLQQMDVHINFYNTYKETTFYNRQITQTTYIEIEPNEEWHLDKYLQGIKRLQEFLGFANCKAIYPTAVIGKSLKDVTLMKNGKPWHRNIGIYYQTKAHRSDKRKYRQDEILFDFKSIQNEFGSIIQLWLERYEPLSPVFDLYFGIVYNERIPHRVQFINLCQALEAYHRRVMGGEFMSGTELNDLRNTLKNAIPETITGDFRNSLEGKLKYMNEFSLMKWLKDIFDRHSEVAKYFGMKRKSFTKLITDWRNYLTHFDEESRKKLNIPDDQYYHELYYHVVKMKILLECCLMSEIGLEGKQLGFLKNNAKYNYLFHPK